MKLVCIDAGHGKETPGKRSFDGSLREYEFNRDVAIRIKKHLERHGAKVLLTAPSDADTNLANRCKIANVAKADIFVSIHANAYGTTWNDANGWEIFVCKGSITGKKLAQAIRSESIPHLGLKDRGIKDNELYVTTNTNMPAVLIEHGFYTNLVEMGKLKSDEFRQKCALADARGILEYLGIAFKEEEEMVKRYNRVAELPKSLQKEAQELIDSGALKGDTKGKLDVTDDMIRCMIVNKRYTDGE